MAVFTAGLWSCRPTARNGGRYRCVLLSYISVELIYVYCFETLPSFPSWTLRERVLTRKWCTISVPFKVITEERSEFFVVVRVYKTAIV
jgi:hypothetical protein